MTLVNPWILIKGAWMGAILYFCDLCGPPRLSPRSPFGVQGPPVKNLYLRQSYDEVFHRENNSWIVPRMFLRYSKKWCETCRKSPSNWIERHHHPGLGHERHDEDNKQVQAWNVKQFKIFIFSILFEWKKTICK
jgi:hypothetical protein